MNDLVWWRRAVLADSELSPTAKVVAMVLHEFMDWRGPSAGENCYPSLDLIAACSGLSRSTVKRALDQLEAEAWVARDRGGGRGHKNWYRAALVDRNRDMVSPFYERNRVTHEPVSTSDGRPQDTETGSSQTETGSSQAGNRFTAMTPDLPVPSHEDLQQHQAGAHSRAHLDRDFVAEDFPQSLNGSGGQQSPVEHADHPQATKTEWVQQLVERCVAEDGLDTLREYRFANAFTLGWAVAELLNAGVTVYEEQFFDLAREVAGFDDERNAWAGFHRFRRRTATEDAFS